MRVLFLTAWYPSKYNPVAGIFVREHAKAVSLFNEVVVLYAQAAQEKQDKLFAIEDCVEEGVRTLRVYYRRPALLPLLPKILYFLAILYGWRYIRRRDFLPDIIHGHVCTVGIPAIILGRMLKKPVVFTEHSTGFPRRNLPWYDILSARFAYPRADMVCPVSADLAGHIAGYGIKANFHVVPNTVNLDLFSAEGKRPEAIKKILTVAMLDPKKGIPYLLEALAEISRHRTDFVLDIVGDGPYREEYEKMAADLGIGRLVAFHGVKPKEEVAAFMRECDLFVLPSLWETFGVVLVEAMACGKPVLATAVGGVPEIVNPGVGKLIPPKDPVLLAKAIDEMLDNLTQYDHKAIASYARKRFSYEAVGKAYDMCYQKVLKEKELN